MSEKSEKKEFELTGKHVLGDCRVRPLPSIIIAVSMSSWLIPPINTFPGLENRQLLCGEPAV